MVMLYFRSLLAVCVTIAASLFFSDLQAQPRPSEFCVIRGGVAHIVPYGMVDMREVTVLRPDGGVVYLHSPQLGVYHLTVGVRGSFDVDPRIQLGAQYAEDGKLHQRSVFSDAGVYRLIVLGRAKDSASGIQYARVGCALDFSGEQGVRKIESLNADALNLSSFLRDCQKKQGVMAGCRASSGCQGAGHGYCCSESGVGSPCYCNNCCVAWSAGSSP
ncbi:hypothetical protein [Thermomonas sp.]|uniref:hypothetical protein n=1 Tax=Thermomonas sp. TaxID=1971895 RepID=UPI003D0F2853